MDRLISVVVVIAMSAGCAPAGPVRDPTGAPQFDRTHVPHVGGEPYFCFDMVDPSGMRRAQCDVLAGYCGRDAAATATAGMQVTGGCHPVESVACYMEFFPDGRERYFCWGDVAQCQVVGAQAISMSGRENISACAALDRSFHTPSR